MRNSEFGAMISAYRAAAIAFYCLSPDRSQIAISEFLKISTVLFISGTIFYRKQTTPKSYKSDSK